MGKVAIRNTYVDYLLSTNGHISSTSLSEVLENQYSHDQINRMLYNETVDDKTVYREAKALKKVLPVKGKKVIIFDDSVQQPYSQPNGLIAWFRLRRDDLELTYEQVFMLYKRRWRVEEYHKSLKSNCFRPMADAKPVVIKVGEHIFIVQHWPLVD